MNLKLIRKVLGILLICEAALMLPSLVVSIIYRGPDIIAFITSSFITFAIGVALSITKVESTKMYSRDGFSIVALGWIVMSLCGALPFYISNAIPSFIDCFFESSSGFTTTGASILTQIEGLPHGILFWRSFTHWVGGMGVIVLTLAILPSVGAGSFQMMKAESPGPSPGKLVPRVRETAKILYTIYLVFTFLEVVLLKLSGMPLYDAFIHTFGTVGTGGFSNMNASVGAYNNVYVEIIITVFMFLSGTNFALYFLFFKGNFKAIFKDEELRFYMLVVFSSIALVTWNLHGHVFKSIFESLRYSSFQVVSIISTTGYATTDFDVWPLFSKVILLMLMFVGGCAGSTGGAMKNIRILMLFRIMKRELHQVIHPNAVYVVRYNGKAINERTVSEVLGFFFMYVIVFVAAIVLISFENMDWITTISSVAATIGNIGPGFSVVGAVGNYSSFSDLSKLVLSMCMIIGRLEIYPVLLLAIPSFWKKVSI